MAWFLRQNADFIMISCSFFGYWAVAVSFALSTYWEFRVFFEPGRIIFFIFREAPNSQCHLFLWLLGHWLFLNLFDRLCHCICYFLPRIRGRVAVLTVGAHFPDQWCYLMIDDIQIWKIFSFLSCEIHLKQFQKRIEVVDELELEEFRVMLQILHYTQIHIIDFIVQLPENGVIFAHRVRYFPVDFCQLLLGLLQMLDPDLHLLLILLGMVCIFSAQHLLFSSSIPHKLNSIQSFLNVILAVIDGCQHGLVRFFLRYASYWWWLWSKEDIEAMIITWRRHL